MQFGLGLRQVRLALWCGGACLIAASAGIVIAAWRAPLAVQVRYNASTAATSQSGKQPLPDRQSPTIEPGSLSSIKLRQPLVPPRPPPPPTLALTFGGTIQEGERLLAVLGPTGGKSQICRVGDVVGGAEITGIDFESVTVRYNGSLVTLKVDRPALP